MAEALSVSVSYDENTAENHSRRDYTPKSAEASLSGRNVTIIDCPDCRQAFDDFFMPSVDRYNAKQKREDRKKNYSSYFDAVESGQEGYGAGRKHEKTLYHYVIQLGNRDDNGVTDADFDADYWRELRETGHPRKAANYVKKHLNNSAERENAKQALTQICSELPGRYPNVKVFMMQGHDDEPNGTYHVDMICTFFTSGEKTGLDTRVSQTKGLKAMGFASTGEDSAVTLWRRDVMQYIETRMADFGLSRQFKDNHARRMSMANWQRDLAIKLQEAEADEYSRRTRKHADDQAKKIIDEANEQATAQRDEAEKERQRAEEDAREIRQAALEAQARVNETQERTFQLGLKNYLDDVDLREREEMLTKREAELREREDRVGDRETALKTSEAESRERIEQERRDALEASQKVIEKAKDEAREILQSASEDSKRHRLSLGRLIQGVRSAIKTRTLFHILRDSLENLANVYKDDDKLGRAVKYITEKMDGIERKPDADDVMEKITGEAAKGWQQVIDVDMQDERQTYIAMADKFDGLMDPSDDETELEI